MGMTKREFQRWIDCDTDYSEDSLKAVSMSREDDADLCNATAIQLLEHLDPLAFAVQASASGIQIYPRHHIFRKTTWEQTLGRTLLPIPADWIGGLALIDRLTKTPCKRSSDTSEMLQNSFREAAVSERAQAVAFSLNRLNQKMLEFSSVGATSGTESTQDASQSIFKGRSGRRRWQRSEKRSSET